jgi:hypothetical protein
MRKSRRRKAAATAPEVRPGGERSGDEPENIRVYGNPRNTVPGPVNS